jgi:hypothetical protein
VRRLLKPLPRRGQAFDRRYDGALAAAAYLRLRSDAAKMTVRAGVGPGSAARFRALSDFYSQCRAGTLTEPGKADRCRNQREPDLLDPDEGHLHGEDLRGCRR